MDDLQALEPWLVLQKIPGLGLTQAHQLLNHFLDPGSLLQAGSELAEYISAAQFELISNLQKAANTHPIYQQVKKEIDCLDANSIHAITLHSPLYPALLKETYNPPLVLYVKGDPYALVAPQLAVVGARKASKGAMNIAHEWSQELVKQEITITSGLAQGIDGAAHAGALNAKGKTIAVLAHGLDQVYPRQHQKLAEEIIASGALVTEFACGVSPKRDHFPRRNRIISGLSLGVLVVEAALKSGSLISARYALEQNREVFAVPGSINNKMVQGCHYLIKDGAYLVESAQEIIDTLSWQTSYQRCYSDEKQQQKAVSPEVDAVLSPVTRQVLEAVPFDLTHLDVLVQDTALNVADLSRELMMLEINGLIESVAGNYQRLK